MQRRIVRKCLSDNKDTHIVYNVFLGVFLMRSWHVNGADDVDLVVFERYVALIDVYDVVCVVYPESETHGKEITTQNTHIHRNPFRCYFDKDNTKRIT
jgi:hypothetical protein